MRVYIVGPFKTATHTFEMRFQWLNDITVKRGHSTEIVDFGDTQPKLIIVPLRSSKNIYPSAFFQDITTPAYPYCYSASRQEVLEASPGQLVDFFRQLDFSKYEWLNYNRIFESLETRLGIDLSSLKDQSEDFFDGADPPFYIVKQGDTTIGFYHVKHLNNEAIFRAFGNQLGFESLPAEFFNSNHNIGYSKEINLKKWYSDKYQEFLSELSKDNN